MKARKNDKRRGKVNNQKQNKKIEKKKKRCEMKECRRADEEGQRRVEV